MISIKLTQDALEVFENVFKNLTTKDVLDISKKLGYETRTTLWCFLNGTQSLPLDKFLKLMEYVGYDNTVILEASAKRRYEGVIKDSTIEIRDTELRNLLIQELLVNGEEVVKNIFDLGKRLYFGYEVQR